MEAARLHRLLQQTRKWNDSTWEKVDMESLERASEKSDMSQRIKVAKLVLYGWNNMGEQCHTIQPEASSSFLSCCAAMKT